MVEEFKQKINFVERKYDMQHYEVLQRFIFERMLERISVSRFQDNFILKGGLLLSAMFGIENRTTKDIDTNITGINISKQEMIKVLNEILSIDLNDKTKFEILNVSNIKEKDEYGGQKYNIIGIIKNLKIGIEIDISTGDIITPRKLRYKYHSLFENKEFIICSYNIETIIAEKLEIIMRRGKFNSRMKDYYDIYYFLKNMEHEINKSILIKAIENTFNRRCSTNYLIDYKKILKLIIESPKMDELWTIYSNKYKYAEGIEFTQIILIIEKYMDNLQMTFV